MQASSKQSLAITVARSVATAARNAASTAREAGSEIACASLLVAGDICDQAAAILTFGAADNASLATLTEPKQKKELAAGDITGGSRIEA